MPRGKKTSATERNNWRRDYDESGKSLEDIAKGTGRAISTVSKGIDRARAEEEIKKVRLQQLADAYQFHTSDLLYAARAIQNADSTKFIKRPESLGALGSEMLLEGLRSHIPSSQLWRASRERGNQSSRIAGLRKGLDPHIDKAVDRASRSSSLVSLEGFRKSLNYAVDEIFGGRSINSTMYKIEGRRKYWAAIQISDASDDDNALEKVEKIHCRVLKEVVEKVPVKEYAKAKEEQDNAQLLIDEEVELLSLRRIVPGDCRLCPRY